MVLRDQDSDWQIFSLFKRLKSSWKNSPPIIERGPLLLLDIGVKECLAPKTRFMITSDQLGSGKTSNIQQYKGARITNLYL